MWLGVDKRMRVIALHSAKLKFQSGSHLLTRHYIYSFILATHKLKQNYNLLTKALAMHYYDVTHAYMDS